MNKIKKPTIKRPQMLKRRAGAEERVKEAFANVPKITNETVAEHREDVLKGARKYIYPLKHSRRRAVTISASIFVTAVVVFMAYVSVSLYKFQSTSGFMYGVTKVIPFPVAKAGKSWVSYNSYLFELRRYTHYYTTQQEADFKGKDKSQLIVYKKQALSQVINDAYVKQLAKSHAVHVTSRQVDQAVQLLRSQNRLGTSDREFREVLNEYWGWDVTDFKRSLQQELLAQAVVSKLDTATSAKVSAAVQQLSSGSDFATLADQVSEDDATKANGGQYVNPIDHNTADVPPQVVTELYRLKPGQISGVINTGFTLEIAKLLSAQDGKLQAAHISFVLQPIETYVKPQAAKHSSHRYIKV